MRQLHTSLFKTALISAGIIFIFGSGPAWAHGGNGKGKNVSSCFPYSQKVHVRGHHPATVFGTACKGRGGHWNIVNSSMPAWQYRVAGPMVVHDNSYRHHNRNRNQHWKKQQVRKKHQKHHNKHKDNHAYNNDRSKVIYKSKTARRYNQHQNWNTGNSGNVTIRYNW